MKDSWSGTVYGYDEDPDHPGRATFTRNTCLNKCRELYKNHRPIAGEMGEHDI